ncbi:MAG: sulfatase-like hydrolase/transferase [Acidobacteria bacterium]|nr:sulfatase-like hydrolase/transferase [Acidobacteriota bacterium]
MASPDFQVAPTLRMSSVAALGLVPALALALALGLAGLAGLAGCAPTPDHERWNVLLVTFDTTRADHLGCYGNDRIETPTLDGLAAGGVRFSRTLSAVPITAPSHSTIMTGRYPIAHGVRDNGLFKLEDDQLTLAEILKAQGYDTAAAIGAFPVTAQFGLNQGFDFFDDHLTGAFENYLGQREQPKERLFFDERRAAQVNEAILPWLTEHSKDPDAPPFFVWVHYFDAHQPFEPAPPYDQLYADDLYSGEIAYADSRLGFLLKHLESLGQLDHTLVVMTADHGEGLGEHNEITHALLAYNSTLHVPLIIHPPGEFEQAGTVVDRWVGTVDIVPTILDLLGIDPPEGLQGNSLVPLWHGGDLPRRSQVRYAENLSPRLTHGWGEFRVLFDGPMKLIFGPRPELYDLDADPHELHNLLADRPDEADEMRRKLQAFIDRNAVAGSSTTQTVSEEVRQRLESLGYLSSSGTAGEKIEERLRSDGVPPQDRVGDLNHLSAAKQLIFEGRGEDALVHTRRLVERSPTTPLYLELHATALIEAGRLDEGWELAQRLESKGALPESLILQLTVARFQKGDGEGAVRLLKEFLEDDPSARGFWVLASFEKNLGDAETAHKTLLEALELDPGYAPARVDLAIQLDQAGDTDGAEAEFRRALKDAPYYAKASYNYGTFLLHGERYDEAAGYFRRAVDLSPGYLAAHVALVASYLAAEERTQAEDAYQELHRIAPDSPEAASAAELLAAT